RIPKGSFSITTPYREQKMIPPVIGYKRHFAKCKKNFMDNTFLPLTPILHLWVQRAIEQPTSLFQAIERQGSPINIHHLSPLKKNINAYEKILNKYQITHKI